MYRKREVVEHVKYYVQQQQCRHFRRNVISRAKRLGHKTNYSRARAYTCRNLTLNLNLKTIVYITTVVVARKVLHCALKNTMNTSTQAVVLLLYFPYTSCYEHTRYCCCSVSSMIDRTALHCTRILWPLVYMARSVLIPRSGRIRTKVRLFCWHPLMLLYLIIMLTGRGGCGHVTSAGEVEAHTVRSYFVGQQYIQSLCFSLFFSFL